MINQNKLAKAIALVEGKKVEVNIAQIKEVQKCLLVELAKYDDREILSLINKVRKA